MSGAILRRSLVSGAMPDRAFWAPPGISCLPSGTPLCRAQSRLPIHNNKTADPVKELVATTSAAAGMSPDPHEQEAATVARPPPPGRHVGPRGVRAGGRAGSGPAASWRPHEAPVTSGRGRMSRVGPVTPLLIAERAIRGEKRPSPLMAMPQPPQVPMPEVSQAGARAECAARRERLSSEGAAERSGIRSEMNDAHNNQMGRWYEGR